MQQDDLKRFLTDLAGERIALIQRHEASARVVGHYDFNNTYQYVIAREETHLSWLQSALTELGAVLPHSTLLGESLEHQRLFEQAAGGFEDVIGRRTGGVARVGAVLPDRWQE